MKTQQFTLRTLVSAVAIALVGRCALAQLPISVYEFQPSVDNPWAGVATPSAGFQTPQFESTAWDGWSSAFVGGVTVHRGFAPWSGHEIGENMTLAPGTAGLLSDLGFIIVNRTSAAMGGILNVQYSCYEPTGRLVFRRELDFDFTSFPIPNMTAALIHVGQGTLLSRGDLIPDQFFFTFQLSNETFALTNDLETYFGSPLNAGTSDRTYRDFTSGQTIELPEDQNLGFFVKTYVPSPGSLTMLTGAMPFVLRRRR